MKFSKTLLLAVFSIILVLYSCKTKEPESKYAYESVANDPLNARIYTLKNGLKVYISVNPREPRVQTYIAVRAGSKSDPKETTGLAHYLEHMVFKGTHDIGTMNWEAEKVVLDSISAMYELHKNIAEPAQKKIIYKKIDSLSYEASKFAVPNEYDKMITSLGAKGTNAYTWVEQTVYVNDIPSNELEKWMMIESNRFRTLVLRLFHTELEAVYEEFNRAQDNDGRKSWDALQNGLYPNHPYGTQTTLGEGEHLKNPSMVNIHNYFDKYYVPNNIAICLAGDLDPDKTVAQIEKYFGGWQPKEVSPFIFESQPEYTEPVVKESFGPQEEHVYVGFRTGGANSRDAIFTKLISAILYNGQAGLVDLNLNQQQKTLSAEAFDNIMADYGMLGLYGEPREGQTLEEVKNLLLAQIELLKKGEFDEWLLEAAVKNMKLDQIKAYETNRARADKFVGAFVLGQNWESATNELNEMQKITKQELVQFVNEQYKNNYVVSYKRIGTDATIHKVDKPQITPVVMNRDTQSAFVTKFDSVKSERIAPVFVDYKKEISNESFKDGIEFNYVKNQFNELFELYYIFDMGADNNRELALAVKYLPYLGTDKYSAADLQKEFFKKGLSFDVSSSKDQVYVTLKGLDESFEDGLQLFEHILASAQPDTQALKDMVDGILKEREDAKLKKGMILNSAMVSYAKYGPNSSFANILSEQELKNLDAQKLVEFIKSLTSYKHRIFYYGKNSPEAIKPLLDKYHVVPKTLQDYPAAKVFTELETTENKVYFCNYEMVQAEMILLSKGELYNKSLAPQISLFSEYFGGGLSSIVFQEIREQKALAYAAYAAYTIPRLKNESHYAIAYIGTQADKLPAALDAMTALMSDMPQVQRQYDDSRDAAMKIIENERIVGSSIFWNYETAKRRGLEYDIRKDIYTQMQTATVTDLANFFNAQIKGKKYNYLVLGKKGNVDLKMLEKIGPVEELPLEKIFNY